MDSESEEETKTALSLEPSDEEVEADASAHHNETPDSETSCADEGDESPIEAKVVEGSATVQDAWPEDERKEEESESKGGRLRWLWKMLMVSFLATLVTTVLIIGNKGEYTYRRDYTETR